MGIAQGTARATAVAYEVRRRGRAVAGRRRARRLGPVLDGGLDLVTPLLVNPIEGRSGTTLMMRILDVPEVAFDRSPPFENRYLAYLMHLTTHVPEPSASDPAWSMAELLEGDPGRFGPLPFRPGSLDPEDWQRRLIRLGFQALSEALTAYSGRPVRYYAEKAWGRTIEDLAAAGVGAKVVNLVRDPRDVVASIRATDRRRGYYGFGRTGSMTDAEYLRFLVTTMKRNLATMRRAEGFHDCHFVRYEDLVDNTPSVVSAIGAWLDLRLDGSPSVLRGPGFSSHATSPTAQRSVGRWRQDLADEDLRAVCSQLGPEMERLGYDPRS